MGIAFISKVFLYAFSQVQIPRSQKIIFSFPPEKTYSAEYGNSTIVPDENNCFVLIVFGK